MKRGVAVRRRGDGVCVCVCVFVFVGVCVGVCENWARRGSRRVRGVKPLSAL